ncbi:hypothetical protein KC19_6G013100 [Ceratodon purpureus]|uniref:Uncharacterized protein n=1 Tax=Ceratodon purpureus TaxID=3225 RepID=A0A8T0HDX9_CERPU|nr:hypothetical protein KC19_6G013100 [Ceratodon purpureus]
MTDSERGSFLQPRLDQICEQEQKLAELRRSKGPFDRAVRALTTNIREGYENIILENLPSSESIEQQLWRLHYSFIEEFRARLQKLKGAALAAANVPHKKKAVEQLKFERVGGQYKCFLDEATGFYHGLIAKLGAKHGNPGKLSSSSNITVAEISSSNERFRRWECVCHRCYIYLGDLARYKELHLVVEGRTADWYVAANYYRQASALWPFGGNPHNQLGVLATYAGDNLQALYHYLYSLAVPVPFITARANAKLLFEKNQHHNSQLSNSPEEDVAIDIQMAQAFESHTTKSSTESHKESPLTRLQRRFRVHFITLIGLLFNKAGLEDLSELSTPVLGEAQLLLSQDNMLITSSFTLEKSNPCKNQAFSVMQLVVLLILSIHNVGPKKDKSCRNSDGPEISYFVMQAIIFSFQFMTIVVQHCTRAEELCCSHLFPAVGVFCNWLANYPNLVQQIQGDEECDKLLCSFGKEACLLLAKCLQHVGTAKNHDYDCIAYSEKEGHGTETALWEDKELYGIVPLKYLETSEIAMRTSVLAKSGQNTPDSACVVRVERLMKALTSLSSVFKLDSSELDAIASVSKSSFGWASLRASPSEKIRCSQSSGGSVRTGDGSMELKTQGPCIVQRSIEISLSSHCRKEDRIFLKARDRKLDSVGPSNLSRPPSEVSFQDKTITGGELKASNMPEGSACQQPESKLCENNLETILEEPGRNHLEHKDEGTLCSVGRGALSLGDWVGAPGGGDDSVDATPALKKRKNMSRLSQQAQTHSSGEESLNPSLSFKAVSRTPKPPCVPSCSNVAQPEVGEPREIEQHVDVSGFGKETDTHTTLSLNRQGSAQDPIDLDCVDKDGTELGEVKSGLDSSQSRKRKYSPHERLRGSSPDIVNRSNNEDEAVPRSEEDGAKSGNGVVVETCKQSPLATNTVEDRGVGDAASGEKLNISSQVMDAHSVQFLPDQEPASNHENDMIVGGTEHHNSTILGNSGCSPQEQIQKPVSSRDTPRKSLEGCSTVAGGGKKRKQEAMTPQGTTTLPSTRCQNCQGTSPGESDSERLNWSRPQKSHVDAGFSKQWRHGWCRDCKEPHRSSAPCYSSGWHPPSKRPRVKEWETEEDYSWLDTYTHVVPQALTKLATAMSKASFSFSDFGIYFEFGANVSTAK